MNDFTRYELQSLLWAIDYVRERTNNCGDTMRSLQGKLIEMIDNYCEHPASRSFVNCGVEYCVQCKQEIK